MRVLIDCLEILHYSYASAFLVDHKDLSVELASGRSHLPQFQQFLNVFLDNITLRFWNLEMLDIDLIFTYQFNVAQGPGTLFNVVLVRTDHFMMGPKKNTIFLPKFLRDI
jgi:hypothetical protein